MDGNYFNGTLRITKSVQPCCRICGHNEDWEFSINANVRNIIRAVRQDGWSAGPKGLICPKCRSESKE